MKYTFTVTPTSLDSLIKEQKTFEFPTKERAEYWIKKFEALQTFLDIDISDINQILDESDKLKLLEKISVSFDAETDGDFSFRADEFSKRIAQMSNKDKKYSYNKPHYGSFSLRYNCDGKADSPDAKMQARDFIENIVRYLSFGHLFLMDDFYNMYQKASKWLFNKPEESSFCWTLSGNYEGTELCISRKYEEIKDEE